MTEQSIQKSILNKINPLGYWFKVVTANKSGIPDIMGGVTVTITPDMVGKDVAILTGIEVKKKGGRVSKLQTYNIAKIVEAGGLAGVAFSVDEAISILKSENENGI